MIEKEYYFIRGSDIDLMIFKVLEYHPKGECWSINTVVTTDDQINFSLEDEDHFMFKYSNLHKRAVLINEARSRGLIKIIFTGDKKFFIGRDYR